jgi:ABC-type transport system involved in cytochrome c biogenesis permease component
MLLPDALEGGVLGKVVFNFAAPISLVSAIVYFLLLAPAERTMLFAFFLLAGATVLAFVAQVIMIYLGCAVSGICF